jgi:protein SCO1
MYRSILTQTTVLLAFGAACAFADSGYSQPGYTPSLPPLTKTPAQLEGVGVDEQLGHPVDLDLTFTDEQGQIVKLGDFFHKNRPVLLNLVYYNCPQLCTLILNGQTQAMRQIPWTPGKEYEVVTISIDPRETPEMARQKKSVYLNSYARTTDGWHFLTDHDNDAKKLAEQVGFHYRYDPRIEQYAHVAAIMILSPSGKMARYLYGVNFRPVDLRFGLAEASEGRSVLTIQKVLLFCYHYDPNENKYVLFATNFMRVGGALTVLLVGFFLYKMIRLERARKERLA